MSVTNIEFERFVPLHNRCVKLTNFGQVSENPSWKIDSHRHDFFELHYIDHGSGMNISSSGDIRLERGTLYIAKPGETHAQFSDPNDPMKLFYAGFYVDDLQSQEPWELEYANHFLTLQTRIVLEHFFPIEPIVSRIIQEMNDCREHSTMMIGHLFSQLFIEMFRSLKERFSDRGDRNAGIVDNVGMIRNTVDYMKNHLFASYENDFFAKRVCMSPSHFRRSFRQVVGVPPAKYFLNLKIEHAKLLLIGSRTVTETAEQVGFDSVEHFSKTFKKCVGMCPSHYQRQRPLTLPLHF
jgi:AraC-like DNA-binding protein